MKVPPVLRPYCCAFETEDADAGEVEDEMRRKYRRTAERRLTRGPLSSSYSIQVQATVPWPVRSATEEKDPDDEEHRR